MLRRYLIVNGISTVLMYGAIWALVPSPVGVFDAFRRSIDTFTMESPVLGPLLHRIVTISAN